MEQIKMAVHRSLADLAGIPEAKLTPDTQLLGDLALDSISFLTFLSSVESQLSLQVPDDDVTFENFKSVGQAIAYFEALQARAGAGE